jgi:signal transduction histidine kinase
MFGPQVMPSLRSQKRDGLADFLPVSAVVLAGLVVSVFVFVMLRGHYLSVDRQQFQRDAAYHSGNFKSDVDRHVASLAAIHAFVSASHNVNRWEFSAFAHQILPQNSGFRAVLWLPQVSEAQRKGFETGLQRDGLYGLHLRELTASQKLVDASARPVYLPVAYVEPFESSGNLLGVDLSNSGIYAQLIRQARLTGRQAATGPLTHTLVEQSKPPPIVLVAFPLNRITTTQRGAPPQGPEGYVLGVLQLAGVIDDAIGAHAPIQAAIGYGKPHAPTMFLTDKPGKSVSLTQWLGDAEFHQQVAFTVAGRPFYLMLRSAQHGSLLKRLYAPAGAALLTLALFILLAQSMLTTVLRKHQVEQAVIERTVELRTLNEALGVEVGQRRQAEVALRGAKDRAEAANRAKSAFLATMSHELRTPLNAIIGFSSMLLHRGSEFDAKAQDYLGEINRSGEHLLDLINDILEITQMDTERAEPEELVQVADIMDNAIAKIQPLADQAGVSLKRAPENDMSLLGLPPLQGDSRRLQKALSHLLSNAVKFNRRGGWAQISAGLEGECLAIEVSDNGIGVAPGTEALIADLFTQGDGWLARRHGGAGLGLTFVRRVAHLHGANLNISSKSGEGTTVSLVFPAGRAAKPGAAA